MSGDRFTVDDLARVGACPAGIRRWFTARADNLPDGLDFRSFIREGMSLETARSLNDGIVDRALAAKEAANGR